MLQYRPKFTLSDLFVMLTIAAAVFSVLPDLKRLLFSQEAPRHFYSQPMGPHVIPHYEPELVPVPFSEPRHSVPPQVEPL